MRQKIFHFFLPLLILLPGNTSAQSGFDLTYDFCTDTTIASGIHSCLADSNQFYVFGTTKTDGISAKHGFLASFNYNTQLLWSKKMFFPGERNSSTTDNGIIKLSNDKYLSLGIVMDYAINPQMVIYHPYFYIFNKKGDSLYYRDYKDTFRTRYHSTALVHYSYIVTAGIITSKDVRPSGSGFEPKSVGTWVCKYDTLGALIWERELMHNSSKYPNIGNIVLSADGKHYVVAGDMLDTITHSIGSRIIKIDTAGNIKWIKPILKTYLSWNYVSIATNPTGGYYFVTSAAKQPDVQGQVNYSAIYYGKLNEDGDTLWTRIYSDSFRYSLGYQIQWTKDNKHLVILGGAYQETKPALMKIDTLGNVAWWRMPQHTYNFVDPSIVPSHSLISLSVTPDDRYLAAGLTYDSATGGELSWMILTDSNGCRYSGDPACWPVSVSDIEKQGNDIKIYPNPATDIVYVDMDADNSPASAIITDITGKQMLLKKIKQGRNSIEVSNLPTGLYFIKIVSSEEVLKIGKLLKQ